MYLSIGTQTRVCAFWVAMLEPLRQRFPVKEAEPWCCVLRNCALSELPERVPREDQPAAFPMESSRGSFRSTNVQASRFSFGSSPIPFPHSVPSRARSRRPPPLLGARPRPPPPFLCLKVYLQQKGAESEQSRGRERERERELGEVGGRGRPAAGLCRRTL